MNDYYIRDIEGRVLGPVGLEVIRNLMVAGRLGALDSVSTDGKSWTSVRDVPELAGIRRPSAPPPDQERAHIQRLTQLLANLRRMTPRARLGIGHAATVQEARAAFFQRSKRFHPDGLPPRVAAEVRHLCARVFSVYSEAMQAVEDELEPTETSSVAERGWTYQLNEFAGLREQQNGRPLAEVLLSARNASVFTEHMLVNISQDGLFLAGRSPLPVGTPLDLVLRFEDPPDELTLTGKVIWENQSPGSKPVGVGIKMTGLSATSRDLIRQFIKRNG